jgi:hypothetical protein
MGSPELPESAAERPQKVSQQYPVFVSVTLRTTGIRKAKGRFQIIPLNHKLYPN